MKITLDTPLYIWQQGRRQNQEDALYPPPQIANYDDRCFILCDGMGGHEKGEVASSIVSYTLGQQLNMLLDRGEKPYKATIDKCLSEVYQALDKADSSDQEMRRMGTTLALLCFSVQGCSMAHIGDSRIYHIRPSERLILYKSRDHSVVNDLVLAGEITEAEARTSPSRNILTRAIMAHQATPAEPYYYSTKDLQAGDCFMLCSDGLLEKITDQEIVNILSSKCSSQRKIDELCDHCLGNQDNYSAWLISIKYVGKNPQAPQIIKTQHKKPSKWQILLKKLEHILNNV